MKAVDGEHARLHGSTGNAIADFGTIDAALSDMVWTRQLREVGRADTESVGEKAAALGEILQTLGPLGVGIPDGFTVTVEAYRHFLDRSGLVRTTADDPCAREAQRERVLRAPLPTDLQDEIELAYVALSTTCNEDATDVAVRSSESGAATLNVRGATSVVFAIKEAFASALAHGIDVAVTIQKMVRSDRGSAGTIVTQDPESGHRAFIVLRSSWGLGPEKQGDGPADRFWIHKPTLRHGFPSIVRRVCATKEMRLVYDRNRTKFCSVPHDERDRLSLREDEVLALARWALQIEDMWERPVLLEWAKDGLTGELFIVQAGPAPAMMYAPQTANRPRTKILLELSNPSDALRQALLPSDGVGMVRMESGGLAVIAAAFYPRPVMACLGSTFDSDVATIKDVRDRLGLTNVEVIVPFCRSPEDGERIVQAMRERGLVRGDRGFEVWVLAEIPSNVILAERFATVFDGFVLDVRALTRLTVAGEREEDAGGEAIRWSCARLIDLAHAVRTKVSSCQQAAELVPFLVEHGIDAIGVRPDALRATTERILEIERTVRETPLPPRSSGFQREVRQ